MWCGPRRGDGRGVQCHHADPAAGRQAPRRRRRCPAQGRRPPDPALPLPPTIIPPAILDLNPPHSWILLTPAQGRRPDPHPLGPSALFHFFHAVAYGRRGLGGGSTFAPRGIPRKGAFSPLSCVHRGWKVAGGYPTRIAHRAAFRTSGGSVSPIPHVRLGNVRCVDENTSLTSQSNPHPLIAQKSTLLRLGSTKYGSSSILIQKASCYAYPRSTTRKHFKQCFPKNYWWRKI